MGRRAGAGKNGQGPIGTSTQLVGRKAAGITMKVNKSIFSHLQTLRARQRARARLNRIATTNQQQYSPAPRLVKAGR